MSSDHFANSIDWINRSLDAEEKADAGSVVAWQCVANTLNELVRYYHTITAPTSGADPKYRRYREVQIKKLIVGMLYESVDCIDKWATKLHRQGLLDQNLKELKDEFETRYRVIGLPTLKQIRNAAAFHFTDLIADGDAVVEVYSKIDSMPIDQLDKLIRAMQHCGDAMVHKVMSKLSS